MSELRLIVYAASQVLSLVEVGINEKKAIKTVAAELKVDEEQLKFFLSKE